MAEVSRECGLEVVVDDYVETFKPFLMDIMYSWSKGASFRDICLMTGEMGARRGRNGGRRGGSRAGTRAYPEYSVSSLRLVPSPALPSLPSDIYEGSIIRATRRLDELMQQLTAAAKVVGDEALAGRIEESNLTIRRDIIFAASLYI